MVCISSLFEFVGRRTYVSLAQSLTLGFRIDYSRTRSLARHGGFGARHPTSPLKLRRFSHTLAQLVTGVEEAESVSNGPVGRRVTTLL